MLSNSFIYFWSSQRKTICPWELPRSLTPVTMIRKKKSVSFLQQTSQQTFVGLQDVFKTSWRHVLKTSSTRLQRNSFTSSKTSWRCLAKTSWKTKNCYAKDVFKRSWGYVYWWYLYLKNLNVYLRNLCFKIYIWQI